MKSMSTYLVLAKIIDPELFAHYIKGHLPTMTKFGGSVVFRSTDNVKIHGDQNWDAIAIQEWPSDESFDKWWNSEEYLPWAQIRDKAALITIIKCSDLSEKAEF